MIVNGYEIKPFANLTGANLIGANLQGASLQGTYLTGANLQDAYLEVANLEGACLYGAYLQHANLQGAYLEVANLEVANLRGANLIGANLQGASLQGANLTGANLQGANLIGANLQGASLQGANLTGARLPYFQICPQEGSFVAWKAVKEGIIKLKIPKKAKRTSSLIGRKCRASHVKVLKGSGASIHDSNYFYEEGETAVADGYDDDIRVECTHGIHFFMTKEEAEGYL